MTSSRRPELVITGDDLGLRSDWDASIFEAFEAGVLTSASVVTTGVSYPAAVRVLLAKGWDCGVHLNLIHGVPLASRAEVASLVDRSGAFPGSVAAVLWRYLCGRIQIAEVAIEWRRQIERAFADGLRPSHLNSHYHLHALPRLFRLAIELARQYRIPWVRVPDERPWHAGGAVAGVRGACLWQLSRRAGAVHQTDGVGLVACRGTGHSGGLDRDAWRLLLERIEAQTPASDVIEVMCHPGQTAGESAALRSSDLLEELRARTQQRSFLELRSRMAAHERE